jgi:hypothetical protein
MSKTTILINPWVFLWKLFLIIVGLYAFGPWVLLLLLFWDVRLEYRKNHASSKSPAEQKLQWLKDEYKAIIEHGREFNEPEAYKYGMIRLGRILNSN